MDKNIIFNLPGGIPRLPIHAGALKACHDCGLPNPDTMICTSAGAMVASAAPDLSEKAFNRAIPVLGNLTPGQIFSFHRGLKVKLTTLGVASVGLGTMMLFDDKLSKRKKAFLGLAGLSALLASEVVVGRELLYSKSLFSIDPLINLLNQELDFHAIFNSPIRLEVLIADINRPGEVIFSNHDPENSDADNPEHRQRWLNILRATSRLPGKFPFMRVDGINTVDGEVWTDFPIRQMKTYKKAIRFDYWPPLRPEPAPKEWISDLSRSFDIMRDRCTQKKMENYTYERMKNPSLPEIFCLRFDPKDIAQMPIMKIHNFTRDNQKEMINFGYRLVKEQLPEIKRYLES